MESFKITILESLGAIFSATCGVFAIFPLFAKEGLGEIYFCTL
jgi:hypothetical protein